MRARMTSLFAVRVRQKLGSFLSPSDQDQTAGQRAAGADRPPAAHPTHHQTARLVAVVQRLVRTRLAQAQVSRLVIREHRQLGPQLGQVQSSDLLVEVFRQDIHLLLVLAALALVPQLELGDDLFFFCFFVGRGVFFF